MKIETIAEQLYYTTVRVESTLADGSTSVGTAFILEAKRENKTHLVLITNKHVVEGAETGVLRFHLRDGAADAPQPGKGYKLNVASFGGLWIGHTNKDVDVAAMSMSLVLEQAKKSGKQLFFKSIPQNLCPSEKELEGLDALENIFFVGYPNGIYDQANYLPVLRRGITASPIQVNHDGKPRFLIDAAVFGGSSGRPVFLLDRGMYPARTGGTVVGNRVHLLGIVAAGYYRQDDLKVIERPIPTGKKELIVEAEQMINLGIVYKAETIIQAAALFVA